jgi:hypothetical protein
LPQPKSKWDNQYTKLNSSKFHEKLRQIFINDSFFNKLSCYQEVQLSSLVPGYASNQHCVDWYIEEFRLIIELHGNQHYKRTSFGNTPYEESVKNFNNIKYRDNLKKTALIDAGYEYIEIPYKDREKVNAKYLMERLYG